MEPAIEAVTVADAPAGAAEKARPRLAYRPRVLFPLLGAMGVLGAASLWLNWLSRMPDPKAVAHLRKGNELLAKADGAGAVSEWRLATRIDPDYPEPYRRLGDYLLNRARRPDLAWRMFGRLAQVEPDGPHVYCQLAEALALDNEMEDARPAAQQAVRVEPSCVRARVVLGSVLIQDRLIKEALVHLEHAFQVDPDDLRAGLVLGQALLDNTEFEGARRVLFRTVKAHPRNSKAHYLLGRSYARGAQTPQSVDAALEAFRRAAALEPDAADIHADMGELLVQWNRWEEARPILERARRLNPRALSVAHNLAAVYRRLGRARQAREMQSLAKALLAREQRLRILLKRFHARPFEPQVTLALARAELDEGNLSDALKYTTGLLRQDPNNGKAMALLERIYAVGGKPDLAEAVRDHIERNRPAPAADASDPASGPAP